MTPEAATAAGATFADTVACTLPDGSVEQLSPEECSARGGSFGDDIHQGLKELKAGLEDELDKMGGKPTETEINNSGLDVDALKDAFDKFGKNMITSLLNIHESVTVGSVQKETGRRRGFYQQDLKQ